MKFNFRKIASTIASTAMLGSTVALAAAANFPAPFVQNGVADVAIVYGNSLDLAAVTDISTALSSALATSEGTGEVSNDAYALYTSSTPIQINNSISSVRSSVTESNLPAILSDTDFSGNVDATASFQIVPGPNRVTFAKQPSSSDDPTLAIAMSTSATGSPFYLYNATVTFNKAVNFTAPESEGEQIELFGQKFTIGSATDTDELVLFRAAETLYLSVGGSIPVPSETVTVDGSTYTVELVAASDTSATVKVTNAAGASDQKEVNEAASKKINGLEVSVNNADESTATNVIQAEVVVGASRIKLQHNSAVLFGTDDESIDGTRVYFNGTGPTADPGFLTKLTIAVFAEDSSHDAIQIGDSITDPVFGSFRFAFSGTGVEEDDWETISVKASGSDKVSVAFDNWQGKSLSSFEFVNNETGGPSASTAFLGTPEEWRIYAQEMATINESAYAVVGNEDDGYLVKLKQLSNGSTGYSNDKVVFENAFDSAETWDASITSEGSGTIQIGGKSYTLNYVYDTTAANSDQKHVRLNDGESSGQNMILYNTIETSKGAKLALYEPLTVDLNNWDGTNDLAGFLLPDGDGYTTLAATAGTVNNWSIGTSAYFNVTSSAASVNQTIGQLTYAFVGAGAAAGTTNLTTVYLLDPRSGAQINYPSIVIFEEKDESSNYEAVIVQTSGAGTSTSGMGVGDTDFTWNDDNDFAGSAWGSSGLQLESNDDMYEMMDQYGTKVSTDQSDSDQYSVEVMYPDNQVTALVYVDGLVTGTGSTTLGDVKVMDDELASSGMSGKNLIVVGGSCVNTAASTLLSNAGCGASWTAATGAGSGEWVIQTLANPWASSKVATLVGGWEQGDTANAATYLKTQNPKTDVSHKLTGTTATTATVVTA